jgi:hypothetical protein
MNLTSDKLATIAGLGMGVLNSVGTVAGQMQPGTSMHPNDYVSLGISLIMVFAGWITNKHGAVNLQSPLATGAPTTTEPPVA